jgi:hypothetical protein
MDISFKDEVTVILLFGVSFIVVARDTYQKTGDPT